MHLRERRPTMFIGAHRRDLARALVAVFVAAAMVFGLVAGVMLPTRGVLAVAGEPQGGSGGGDLIAPVNEEDLGIGGGSEPGEEPEGGFEEPEFGPMFVPPGGGQRKATLIIKKYGDPDIDGRNVLIGGATFRVEYCALLPCLLGGWMHYATVTDNEGLDEDPTPGIIKLSNVDPDLYRIRETVAPSGYKAQGGSQTVILGKGQQKTVSFTNLRDIDRPAILIKKVGEGQPLGGAKFKICVKKQSSNECRTDKPILVVRDNGPGDEDDRDGFILVDGLSKNTTYLVFEEAAPEGWLPATSPKTVSFGNKAEVKTVQFHNEREPQADLEVTKTVDNETPFVNEQVTFTITVTNHGPDDATDVVVKDVLPSGLEYVSDDSEGAYNRATGLWTVGNLATGASAVLNITVKVTGEPVVKITNIAKRHTSEPRDPNDDNDRGKASVTPRAKGTIVIKKTDQFGDPVPGARFELLDEEGSKVAEGLTDEDGILRFEGVEPGRYTVEEVEVPEGYEMGQYIRSDVGVFDTGEVEPDPVEFTNTKLDQPPPPPPVTTTRTPRVDLAVTKVVDNPTPEEGQIVTFTVTVTNEGPDDARNVVFSDLLPEGLTYLSHTASQGTYDPVSGQWEIGNLDDDESATLTVQAIVNPGTAGQVLTNRVTLVSSSPSDRDASNNSASASVAPPQVVQVEEEVPLAGQDEPPAAGAPPLPVTGGSAAAMVIPGLLALAAGVCMRRWFR